MPRFTTTAPRRPTRRLVGGESLEVRRLLAFDPSPFEQEQLEHINRMRMDPAAELGVFFESLSPLSTTEADPGYRPIQAAIDFFGVDSAALQAQWSALEPAPPLAWNEDLIDAALGHSEKVVETNIQAHRVWDDLNENYRKDADEPWLEPNLLNRILATDYDGSSFSENVYAYAESGIHGHAGFVIDWGTSPTGIQNPPGHRNNIMSSSMQEVGISVIDNSANIGFNDNTTVGPLVITQNFGQRPSYKSQLLGVVWEDGFSNGYYEAGEGYVGFEILAIGDEGVFVVDTMSAGGFQMEVPAGTYDVIATGDLLGSYVVRDVVVGDENVKVDFEIGSMESLGSARATDDSFSVQRPGLTELDVLGNDNIDVANLDLTTLAVIHAPQKGTLRIAGETGLVTYAASGCEIGDDSFSYRVLTHEGLPLQGTVTLSSNAWDHPCGDANQDGNTDETDLSILQANMFTENADWTLGDFNGDSFVDGTDFNLWNESKVDIGAGASASLKPTGPIFADLAAALPTRLIPGPGGVDDILFDPDFVQPQRFNPELVNPGDPADDVGDPVIPVKAPFDTTSTRFQKPADNLWRNGLEVINDGGFLKPGSDRVSRSPTWKKN